MTFKQLPTIISDLNKLGIAIKAIDTINISVVGVNKGNLNAFRTAIKGLSTEQAVFALASKGATEEQIRQILITKQSKAVDVEAALAKAGLTTATSALTQAEMVELATKTGVAKADAEALLNKIGITAAEEGQVAVKHQVTMAMLEQAVANGTLTSAESAQIATMLGLNAAETANIGITNILTGAVAKLWAVITAHPVGAILTAIGVAVIGIATAYKKYGDTLENAKKKLEDVKQEYNDVVSELQSVNEELKTIQSRMEELERKDKLTFTEKNEYNNLVKSNNELQRKIDLLELEKKKKQEKTNQSFVHTMEKDTEDPFEYEVNPDGKNVGQYGIDDNYLTDETGYINAQFKKREKLVKQLSKTSTKKEKESIQSQIDEIDKYFQDKNSEWAKNSENISYIENPQTDNEKKVNEWLDYISDFQDRLAIELGGNNAKQNAFNRVVDNWQFDDAVQGLQDLGKEGKVTAEMLDNSKYIDFINKLVEIGVIDSADNLDDIALAFNSVSTETQDASDSFNEFSKNTFKSLWKSIGTGSDDASKAAKEEKENLLKLAEQGKLTDKVFKKSSIAQTFTDAGFSIAEATKKINNLVDSSKQLSSLKSGIKLIQDAFADKRDNKVAGADTLSAMEETFGSLKSWKGYKETLGSTTSDLDACRKAQNELASEYINSNNFLSKLVKGTGEVDEKTKQYYTSQLKELGIKNAKDIVDQQIINRQKEIAQAKSQEIIDIKTSSIDLQNATQDEIQSLIDETEQLEGNTNALKLYLLQKMMSKDDAFDTEESVNNLINLANECNASETVVNSLKGALKNLQDKGNVQLSIGLDFSVKNPLTGTSIGNSLIGNSFPTLKESVINDVANDQQNLNDEFQKNKDNALSENEKRLRKQYKKLQAKINTLLKDAASSNSKSNGSSSSKSNTSKEFNWIDVLIKRTERKVQKSIDRITDYASKKTKNNLFGKALKAYGKEEKTYANASDFYLKKFNKVKISKNAKKDAEWKRKIKNGKLDIQTITNEKLADKISKAQDYYDNYLDYQDKQTGAKQNALALRKQKLDDDIAYIEAKSDRIQRLSDSVQNRIDNNDALGLAISENSYKELIKYSKKQVKRWIDEKATYAEYLSTLKRGSTEYIETEQKIADCDSKIQDAKKSQLEWNQTIAQMPLDKFERLGNVISSIITNLGNFNSLLESQQ